MGTRKSAERTSGRRVFTVRERVEGESWKAQDAPVSVGKERKLLLFLVWGVFGRIGPDFPAYVCALPKRW